MKPDGILVMGTLPDVIDHPEPTKNVWCDSAKRNILVRSEEMSVCAFCQKPYYQAHTNRRN